MEIGDKVRTNDNWNKNYTEITGTVTGFETVRYTVTEPRIDADGSVTCLFTNQYAYTTLVVINNIEKIHESQLVKVV